MLRKIIIPPTPPVRLIKSEATRFGIYVIYVFVLHVCITRVTRWIVTSLCFARCSFAECGKFTKLYAFILMPRLHMQV